MKKTFLIVCLVMMIVLTISVVSFAEARLKIGYITPQLINVYWVTVKNAADDYAKELNVDLTFVGGDTLEELSAIDDMITKGVDVVIISADNSEGIVPGILKLNEAGIPVIGADIPPAGGKMIAIVTVSPVEGGKLLGEFLLKKVGKNGKLFVYTTSSYIEVIDKRQQGAVDLLEPENWTFIRQPLDIYGRGEAKDLTETILLANPDLDAVYAINDDTALGSQAAVEAQGKEDVIVIGYDAIDETVESIKQGRMDATIFVDNKQIVRWSIEQAISYLQTPWTGTVLYEIAPVLVTQDNVKDFIAEHMK